MDRNGTPLNAGDTIANFGTIATIVQYPYVDSWGTSHVDSALVEADGVGRWIADPSKCIRV